MGRLPGSAPSGKPISPRCRTTSPAPSIPTHWRRGKFPHPPAAAHRAPPSPTSWARGKQALALNSPSLALEREREGPSAEHWEGEGQRRFRRATDSATTQRISYISVAPTSAVLPLGSKEIGRAHV